MVDFVCKGNYTFEDLVSLMALLREKCPWDGEQTHASIRENLLEEAYEAAEAIDLGDTDMLREELGDVLLQVVFHARMEEERGSFDIDAVCDGICKKLVHRHPHIFGEVQADSTDAVLSNWEDIKRSEKGQKTFTASLESVAKTLPALWRAAKIQKRARKAGFDFERSEDAWDKLREELAEADEARGSDRLMDELGDLLFAAVNVARLEGIDPERALERTCERFTRRFAHMEQAALAGGTPLENMALPEQDRLWDQAKQAGL